MWEYRATVLGPLTGAVHDGDTVRLLIDLGFDVRVSKWIRLADVRAPELSQPGGQECRSYVSDWVGRRLALAPEGAALGWPMRVVTETTVRKPEPTEITSLERYVGWIYDMATSASLNELVSALVAQNPTWPSGR